MVKIGDKIQIVYMNGEPNQVGKVGTVTDIGKDPWGDTFYRGTWSGLSIYPGQGDLYKILENEK